MTANMIKNETGLLLTFVVIPILLVKTLLNKKEVKTKVAEANTKDKNDGKKQL